MNTPDQFNIDDFLSHKADERTFLAVLGRPISHSLSPLIHNYALKRIRYEVVYYPIYVPEGHEEKLGLLFRHHNFRGANVTLPLKQLVPKHVEQCSETVIATGAANTVYKSSRSEIKAENTDIDGFLAPLLPFKSSLFGKSALIFGSGGAAQAVVYALKFIGMKSIYVVSRNPDALESPDFKAISYKEWENIVTGCDIIVNTSPLGMFPSTDHSPIDQKQEYLLTGKICYDLIYRPLETLFLKQAKSNGAITINGLEMFIGQAAQAFRLFTNQEFPTLEVRNLLYKYFDSDTEESTL